MTITEKIESIHWAFPDGDRRLESLKKIAEEVQEIKRGLNAQHKNLTAQQERRLAIIQRTNVHDPKQSEARSENNQYWQAMWGVEALLPGIIDKL